MIHPDGSQVWFRITSEAVHLDAGGDARGPRPAARGGRLVDALLAWLTPDRQLGPEVNRFQVLVSDDGDTRLERYGGDLKARPRPATAAMSTNGGSPSARTPAGPTPGHSAASTLGSRTAWGSRCTRARCRATTETPCLSPCTPFVPLRFAFAV